MPIYEYQCESCGDRCEFLQKVSEPAKTECPQCHTNTLKKLVSSPSFQLKGSGWYVTDFRDKNKPKPVDSDSNQPTTDTKADDKKAETKKSDSN